MKKHWIRIKIIFLAAAVAAAAPFCVLHAQRLPDRIEGRSKVVLRGSRSPRIDRLTSEGPIADSTIVHGITFRFRPTPEQSADLEKLLDQQQDPNSPLYHAWLTPEEYADRFGLNQDDFEKVSDWIASQGFQIDFAARSRTHISFTGTARQVSQTFGTELHRLHADGKAHFANLTEALVPAEIEPLVLSLKGLDDFSPRPAIRANPQYTLGNGNHALTPGDLAVIYNAAPLLKHGINGSGQKIVIGGQSALILDDVRQFRSAANLPASEPKVYLYPGSADPGVADSVDEALLDVETAGGAAPGATIYYVYGANVHLAEQYAIDQNLAPVLSHSWGECEKLAPDTQFLTSLAQQAAAQGITWVAATGDTGAAGCVNQLSDHAGDEGLGVNLPASIPQVTAVGGSSFTEAGGNYWSSTNLADGTSALAYIPERGWNETTTGSLLGGGGGGVSSLFQRPTWQTGQGVPNDNLRHVPDIAFTAAASHDPYVFVMRGVVNYSGGTSASTPFFAGMLALLNQYVVANKVQAKPGLGNINPRLYQLAQTTKGIFHDITTGDNIMPCKTGTPDCTTGQYGYKAGPGYDQVTGLGSIDIANLVQNWAASKTPPSSGPSKPVITVEPTVVYESAADADGYSWFYTVKITETGGTPTTVRAFLIDEDDYSDSIADWFGSTTLPANGVLSADLRSSNIPIPSDRQFNFIGKDSSGAVWAESATATFLGPKSTPKTGTLSLTSDPNPVVKIAGGDPDCSPDYPFGQELHLVELMGNSVKLLKFVVSGDDYTNYISSWFGSTTLRAKGELDAKICWQLNSLPDTLDYEIDGVDQTGQEVQATLQVQFTDPLGSKSGMVPGKTSVLTGWPGQPAISGAAASKSEAGRWVGVPHHTPNGMVVAPRLPKGRATAPVK